MKKLLFICLLTFVCSYQTAQAQDQYLGEIRLFSGNFAPKGWAICDGRTLPIAQNQALYAIIGTTYGGDGETNFALPDLRSVVPTQAYNGSPDTKLGKKHFQKLAPQKDNDEPTGVTYIHVNYIIALQGIFPSKE
jgi:microcystin-dependent protein